MRHRRNDPEMHDHALSNRRNLNLPEVLLWQQIRRNALEVRFRRQLPIGPYVVDFACIPRRLVAELDGDSHNGRRSEDALREQFIEREGFTVVRFQNIEIYDNMDGVMQTIKAKLEETGGSPPL